MNLYIFQNIFRDDVIASLVQFKETGDEDAYFRASRGLIRYSSQKL